ncbi:MAG: methionine synthase (B12-dependent) [Acidimicrobiaceae bacterium]|nr:methionine synthase (B12-dependent) [Acidimicrobiaceae bacterium]
MSGYLDLLRERVVIFDGATGTNLQLRELGPDDFGGPSLEGCNEALVLSRPDVIRDLHASFFDVGVDVVETDSFGAFPTILAEYQIAERAYEISRRSAELAREVADGYSTADRPRFVAGSIGPGTKFPTLGQISFADLRDSYEVEARALLEGGVDLLLVETCFDLLGAKAALVACRRAMRAAGREVPLQVQVTIELTGRMLPGTEVSAALAALDAMRPDVVGLNCATGPSEMYEPLRYLSEHSRLPISTLPNAGLPSVVDGRMHYDLTPDELAEHLHTFVTELGISVVGGCCGTTPAHLARVVERVGGLVPKRRSAIHEPGAASLYSFVPFAQDQSFLVVGERTNANGSKRFREAMLEGDFETTTEMARDQVREGAHLIDVCVDYTGADGVADMDAVMSRLATQSTVPIMVDSTEPDVVRTALEWLGGRAVLNSVNLEDGDAPGTRLDSFLSLAFEHGAAVVCTCIDEEGQARSADWKVRAARAIHDLAVERYGLEPSDLFFDPLALPLSTGMEEGRRDGIETIEGIRRIKAELPGVQTILGLSNVSFGLSGPARQVLNSVFLHECVAAGLDAAIVHAARILPLHKVDEHAREVCLDLIYDRRRDGYDPLQELIAIFQGVSSAGPTKEDRSGWPVEERLSRRIIDGDRLGIEDDLDEALAAGNTALAIVNDVLLAGMKTVGELFASGEMQLPFVLQSAETMKAAVAHLEPHMERTDGSGRGSVVLATVKGDVHDIGKNLVDIILTNNGYDVHNLGIKVPIADMLSKAAEVNADAIGMSGLLVKSTLIMRENLEEMNRRGTSHVPVLLGGAALTRSYVERDLRTVYDGRVFYGKDAFEGLRTLEKIMEMKRSGVDDPSFGTELTGRVLPPRKSQLLVEVDPSTLPERSPDVESDNTVFEPPFVGTRIAKGIPLDDVLTYLNETALFRNQWGYRPETGESDAEFKERVRAELRLRMDEAKAADVLVPQVAWGYFPASSDGTDLVLFTDVDKTAELTRFSFPRQRQAPYLCIADFFRPVSSPETDYVGLVLTTMGARASEHARTLFEADRYLDYVALHGLSVEMTEALMEYWHRRMREEWGYASEDGPTLTGLFRQKYRGGRYSFGYPACPDLADNGKVVELLRAERIGVVTSDGAQLEPEQTTLAIVCHHPQAKYFVA